MSTPEDLLVNQLYKKLKDVGDTVDLMLKDLHVPVRWIITVWPYGQMDRANKMSNCNDEKEIVAAFRDLADRIEQRGRVIAPPKLP